MFDAFSHTNAILQAQLHTTARQYGEVVLPDEASGQCTYTLASILSRCKEGMARVFAVLVQLTGLDECRGTIRISYCK
jgi:hypothetical protein